MSATGPVLMCSAKPKVCYSEICLILGWQKLYNPLFRNLKTTVKLINYKCNLSINIFFFWVFTPQTCFTNGLACLLRNGGGVIKKQKKVRSPTLRRQCSRVRASGRRPALRCAGPLVTLALFIGEHYSARHRPCILPVSAARRLRRTDCLVTPTHSLGLLFTLNYDKLS